MLHHPGPDVREPRWWQWFTWPGSSYLAHTKTLLQTQNMMEVYIIICLLFSYLTFYPCFRWLARSMQCCSPTPTAPILVPCLMQSANLAFLVPSTPQCQSTRWDRCSSMMCTRWEYKDNMLPSQWWKEFMHHQLSYAADYDHLNWLPTIWYDLIEHFLPWEHYWMNLSEPESWSRRGTTLRSLTFSPWMRWTPALRK